MQKLSILRSLADDEWQAGSSADLSIPRALSEIALLPFMYYLYPYDKSIIRIKKKMSDDS